MHFLGYIVSNFEQAQSLITHVMEIRYIIIAQKSKEIRVMEMGSIFVLYIQPTIPTYVYVHYLKLPDVYVGIVGWIYRTKIDPITILHPYPCFLTFLSNGHPYIFSFHRNVFYFITRAIVDFIPRTNYAV